MGIGSGQLIADFRRMLAEKWGYIPSTSGETWTKEKQEQAAAKSETVARYGGQWIGHRVADCSGAFVWAYRQHGMSIYHGSNRIAREYVTERGARSEERGAALLPMAEAKPGMAAFKLRKPGDKNYSLPSEYRHGGAHYNGDLNDYYHIGLVDTDGSIINAQSTAKGVQRSKASGWSCVGYLKAVNYGTNESGGEEPMSIAEVIGDGKLNIRQEPNKHGTLVNQISPGTEVQVVKTVTGADGTEWAYITCKKGSGYVMADFLMPLDTVDDPENAPEPPVGDAAAMEQKLYELQDLAEKLSAGLDELQRLMTGAAG